MDDNALIYDCLGGRRVQGESGQQLYGMEVEVENAHRSPATAGDPLFKWRLEHDGSLRNSGMEFISPPLTSAALVEQIEMLWPDIENGPYRTGVRTGIHVHVNAQEMTLREVKAVVALYCLVEPLLFGYCGPAREHNNYCVPLYLAPDEVEKLAALRNLDNAVDFCKYSALYLGPLARFGTIEFRQAPTFRLQSQVSQWLRMIEALVEKALELGSPQEVMQWATNRAPEVVFRTVFPDIPRFLGEEYLRAASRKYVEFDCEAVALTLVRTIPEQLDEDLSDPAVWQVGPEPVFNVDVKANPEPDPRSALDIAVQDYADATRFWNNPNLDTMEGGPRTVESDRRLRDQSL